MSGSSATAPLDQAQREHEAPGQEARSAFRREVRHAPPGNGTPKYQEASPQTTASPKLWDPRGGKGRASSGSRRRR